MRDRDNDHDRDDQDPAPWFDVKDTAEFCARMVARGADYAAFDDAFDHALTELFPAPEAGALRDDPALRRCVGRAMARGIWRQMPHPSHRYGPAPLPAPERNDRCHCGSGRKYKACCQSIEASLPIERVDLLPVLLDALPRARWGELPGSRIAVEQVAHTAKEWLDAGDANRALALLEPWFVDDKGFVARHEYLFDLLLDACNDTGRLREKSRLIERGIAVGDRTLRSAAMQRRIALLSDAGDFDAAWALFRGAQRHEPDSPHLSHLEVTLLLAQDREDEARERAKFWALRLAQRRDDRFDDLVELMLAVARDGKRAMTQASIAGDPNLTGLLELLTAAPPIAPLYGVTPDPDGSGTLSPSPALRAAEAEWRKACPGVDYSPLRYRINVPEKFLDAAPRWLPVLRSTPELWNSFEVLNAIGCALSDNDAIGVEQAMLLPVLERGDRLLAEVLRAGGAAGLRVEWEARGNRPALLLLATRASLEIDDPPTPERVARLERLVRDLNPGDNFGFRPHLVRCYLETNRAEDALRLCERQIEDFAAMRYNRALVLHALGRHAAACEALRDAFDEYPKPLEWLCMPRAKPPAEADGFGMTVGGDDEAWHYRDEMRPLWEKFNALDWARGLLSEWRRSR